ncbi:MAG: MFS transporter [Bacteroidetes bacterium]|nr:MFS transporter [Bacteroidota bacterium]
MGLQHDMEAIILSALMSLPLALLGILPPVILAEITHLDSFKTKQNKEATYFAIRSLFIQFGQTLGIAVFTILIGIDNEHPTGKMLAQLFPNIPFEELGIRLSGVFGAGLCFVAAIIFMMFNEKKLNRGIVAMEKEMQIIQTID